MRARVRLGFHRLGLALGALPLDLYRDQKLNIDATTPTGKLLFQITGAFAGREKLGACRNAWPTRALGSIERWQPALEIRRDRTAVVLRKLGQGRAGCGGKPPAGDYQCGFGISRKRSSTATWYDAEDIVVLSESGRAHPLRG